MKWPTGLRQKEKAELSLDFHLGSSCRPLSRAYEVLPRVADLTAWFTFIYRVTGLRAVEDFVVGGLRTLVGHTICGLAPLPSLHIYYSTSCWDCQGVSQKIFEIFLWGDVAPRRLACSTSERAFVRSRGKSTSLPHESPHEPVWVEP